MAKYKEVVCWLFVFFAAEDDQSGCPGAKAIKPRSLDGCLFLLQKMITVDVLAPGPEEEDGGLGLDVIWYKEHHRGETTDEKY